MPLYQINIVLYIILYQFSNKLLSRKCGMIWEGENEMQSAFYMSRDFQISLHRGIYFNLVSKSVLLIDRLVVYLGH